MQKDLLPLLKKHLSKLILHSLFLFSVTHPLLSHICIDVDTFSFPSTKQQGIRVSTFNTEAQAYEAIEYHPFSTSTVSRPSIGEIALNRKQPGLQVFADKTVSLASHFDLTNYIIRTKGVINVPESWTTGSYILRKERGDASTISILYKNVTPQKPSAVLETLNRFKDNRLTPAFNVYFKDPKNLSAPKVFSNISSNKDENNQERGKIGELATTLTMMSYGYFIKAPTQNKSNQGLDGAFLDDSRTFLILTESKCENKSKDAKNYLRKTMSEERILEKTNQLPTHLKETQSLIRSFIRDTPQNVFKLAHRIKPNGECQCAFEPFIYDKYVDVSLSPSSPERDVIIAFMNVIRRTELSPEKALSLFLQANKAPDLASTAAPITPVSTKVESKTADLPQLSLALLPPHSPGVLPIALFSVPIDSLDAKKSSSPAPPVPLPTSLPPSYSLENLKKMVSVLAEKKVSETQIGKFCGVSSTPIRRLLGKLPGKAKNPDTLWKTLIGNLDSCCSTFNLKKSELLKNFL